MNRLFVRTDRIKTVIYLSTILVLGVCLVVSKKSVSEKSGMMLLDEHYIAAGKHFIELLYSLNAASIDEDSFLLTQMIHKDSADKIQEHTSYLIDNEIVKKAKESYLKSRIRWSDTSVHIEKRAQGARVIRFKGHYEYKTDRMEHYQSKPIHLEVSLVADPTNSKARYGVSVHEWDTPANSPEEGDA